MQAQGTGTGKHHESLTFMGFRDACPPVRCRRAVSRAFFNALLASTFALSRAGNSRLSALRAGFSTWGSMRQASKVARLTRPEAQLAPDSPVFPWLLASPTIAICSSKTAQVEASASERIARPRM